MLVMGLYHPNRNRMLIMGLYYPIRNRQKQKQINPYGNRM